ncbi:MAG: MFS transporter [Pseudomonadota bacterium]|nr:MFS transporter [Pseudomonadota bacterium]
MPPTRTFVRTPLTWLIYLMLGYFAYLQSALGPLMPHLLAELGLGYTAGGLHFSAFALGTILAGLLGGRVVRRWGRRAALWGGGIGMAAGGLLIAAGGHLAATLAGALTMGAFGGGLLIIIPATLSDRYGAQRTIALTEANAMASLWAMLVPACIGGFAAAGLGWRSALYLAAALLLLIWARFRHVAVPAAQERLRHSSSSPATALPGTFWAFCGVIFLVVSVEWSLVAWAAAFLQDAVGLRKATASTLMSLFFMAMLAGRLIASRLAHLAPSTTLLFIALGITGLGFPLFWLAPLAPLNVAGLFVAGLGAANLYPFALASALGMAPGQTDAAAARLSLTVGAAILLAPLALGWTADRLDIRQAYGMVAALLAAALAMTVLAARLERGAQARTAEEA